MPPHGWTRVFADRPVQGSGAVSGAPIGGRRDASSNVLKSRVSSGMDVVIRARQMLRRRSFRNAVV
jgi:hypothetical protein